MPILCRVDERSCVFDQVVVEHPCAELFVVSKFVVVGKRGIYCAVFEEAIMGSH
jgi:hypothetical protein